MLTNTGDGVQVADGVLDALTWRDHCKVRWTQQLDEHGCGVACLAMLSEEPYAVVRSLFEQAGLALQRGRKRPFASNFREVIAIAEQLGLKAGMRRWHGWQAMDGLGIIKVPTRAPDWHWMVAERTTEFGVVVYDPAIDWPAFDFAPLDVVFRSPSSLKPCGNWISIELSAAARRSGRFPSRNEADQLPSSK